METNNERLTKVMAILCRFLGATLAKRLLCAILLALGVEPMDVSTRLGLTYKSVKKYEAMLDSDEPSQLMHLGEHKRKGSLDDHKETIFKELDNGSYKTLREIVAMVKEKTGVTISRNRLHVFLKKHGYKPLTAGFFPCGCRWAKTTEVLSGNT